MPREKAIENELRKEVIKLGGIAYKFVSPARPGVPDRLCCFPGGRAIFVECKQPGQKPDPRQRRRIKEVRDLGFEVFIVDSHQSREDFIQYVKATSPDL